MAFNHDRNSRSGGNRGGFRPRPSFGDSSRFSPRGGAGRPRFGDRGDRGPVEMHQAVCDNCGRECEVPFRPTSGKPIFCSNCFENQRRGSDSREGGGSPRFAGEAGRNFERSSSYEEKRMYEAVCDNCGNNCSVPFQPRGDKPIYCSNCFEKKNDGSTNNNGKFDELNAKLDAILKILTPLTSTNEVSQEQPQVQVGATKKTKATRKKSSAKKVAPVLV